MTKRDESLLADLVLYGLLILFSLATIKCGAYWLLDVPLYQEEATRGE